MDYLDPLLHTPFIINSKQQLKITNKLDINVS